MPFIILKKTRKATGTGFSASEKAFSFHGAAVTRTIKEAVNERLASMHRMETANALEFTWDEHIGQYIATMNHDFQKYHEEDALVAILEVMESLGYKFRFEYGTQITSKSIDGSSVTFRELYVFSKDERIHL